MKHIRSHYYVYWLETLGYYIEKLGEEGITAILPGAPKQKKS